jgi:hypothetical protein
MFTMRLSIKCLLAAVVLTVAAASPVQAKYIIDLQPTGSQSSQTAVLGGSFTVASTELQPTGTGVIDPFLTIQQNGQERGYNTSAGTPLDTKAGQSGRTSALQLSEIGTVTIGGATYYEFLLDVNQSANGPISLNQVQIFASAADVGLVNPDQPDQEANSTKNASISFSGATLVFQMSQSTLTGLTTPAGQEYEIWVDTSRGSGSGDMFYYVSTDVFANYGADTYVTLFSQFGNPNGTYASNSGFEEWAVRGGETGNPVPAPPSAVLALIGLAGSGLGYFVRRRRLVVGC